MNFFILISLGKSKQIITETISQECKKMFVLMHER